MLADLHLLRPLWLLAFVPLAAGLTWLARERPGLQRWRDIVDANLAPHVLIGGTAQTRRYPLALLGLAGTLAILALAGPAWQKMPTPVFTSEDGLVIALDLSRSMDTEDVKPSRIARARFKVEDILNRRTEGQTALIVYAAEAFTVSPLTDDTQTIVAQLPALQPALMPAQGSRADRAIVKAQELLEQAGQSRGDVLLITDDADAARAAPAAGELARDGYRLSVLGVGTAAGGPIPGDGSFVKRNDGSIVITSLQRNALTDLARSGNGIYQDLTPDSRDVERLASLFEARQPAAVSDSDLQADVWREEGPWLLLPLLLLAALAFRRGVIAVLALVIFLPPVPAQAFELADLWSRPDQRAQRALQAGDAGRAAQLFRDPAWKAAAEYRAGDFEQASQALEHVEGIDARYNRGNALARLGQYEAAIAAYDDVLEADPAHEDARYNRDLLREQMQQQSRQGESGENNQDQQSESGQDQDQENAGENGQDQQQAGAGQEIEDAGGEQNSDNQQQGESAQQGSDQGQAAQSSDERVPNAQDSETADEEAQQAQAQNGEQSDGESQQAQQNTQAAGQAPQSDSGQATALASADEPLDESEQAVEQWLRRIPDDPGGLLRRKFLYQYNRQQPPEQEQQEW